MDLHIVVLSDLHIGTGSEHEHFECRQELLNLLADLDANHQHLELILLGDFLDLNTVPPGVEDKLGAILDSPHNKTLFSALSDFGKKHKIIYVIGNHEHELCWNPFMRSRLEAYNIHFDTDKLTYYARTFSKEGESVHLYCEHGNQFQPHTRYQDFFNPLDSPLGDHVSKEIYRPLVDLGNKTGTPWLSDVEAVRPYEAVPWFLWSKYFYWEMNRLLRYFTIPIFLGFVTFKLVPLIAFIYFVFIRESFSLFYLNIPILAFLIFFFLVDFSLFTVGFIIFLIKRDFRKLLTRFGYTSAGAYIEGSLGKVYAQINAVVRGEAKRNFGKGPVDIFVFGHFHLASLKPVSHNGRRGAVANCGTWLKRIVRVKSHWRLPPVFLSYHKLTYVTIEEDSRGVVVRLRRRRKPVVLKTTLLERIAIWRRMPTFSQTVNDAVLREVIVPFHAD